MSTITNNFRRIAKVFHYQWKTLFLKAIAQILLKQDIRDIQRAGYHFAINNFYTPLNDLDFLDTNRDLWNQDSDPADIDWNIDQQFETAIEISKFTEELRDIPNFMSGSSIYFHWQNNFWNNADALVQYGLIRSRAPKHYVEIGCGWSSLLLHRALEKNTVPCRVTLIEPYPNERIFAILPKNWTLYRCMVQRASSSIFESLSAGDILFYDGSHCSKVASDVNFMIFDILPKLQPGVIIHFHDIFFPDDYPDEWIFKRGQTWNEQYVLQAFLMNNIHYKILIANRWLYKRAGQKIEQLYHGVQPSYGCSLWLTKT